MNSMYFQRIKQINGSEAMIKAINKEENIFDIKLGLIPKFIMILSL